MSDATVSIVSYCQRDLLGRCLGQIESLGLPPAWPTFVVDNNSNDGSADMVSNKYPWAHLVRSTTNLGFGGGHNLAYSQTTSEFFFVLNPDVTLLPGSLEALLATLRQHPKAAIVGPRLLNADGSFQYSARRFYTWRTVLSRRLPIPGGKRLTYYHLMKDKDLNVLQPVDWLLGAVLGVRRSAFNERTLFDTRYKLYFEDVDLCYFAGARGWEVLYCPQSKMIHDHQRASAKNHISLATITHFSSWVKFWLKKRRYANRGLLPENEVVEDGPTTTAIRSAMRSR